MIRAIQITDLHVEPGDDIARDVMARIVRIARASQVSAWFLTGDVAGHVVPYRPPWSVTLDLMWLVRQLSDIAPGVILAGNHDDVGALQAIGRADGLHPVTVVTGCERLTMPTRDGLIDVHAVAYPRKGHAVSMPRTAATTAVAAASEALAALLRMHGAELEHERRDHLAARIGLGHWLVRGASAANGEIVSSREPTVGGADVEAWGVDYAMLGHLHLAQQVGNRASYPGTAWATDKADTGGKGVRLIDVGDPDGRPDPSAEHGPSMVREIAADSTRAAVREWWVPTGAPPVVSMSARWGDTADGIGWITRPTEEEIQAAAGAVVHLSVTRQSHTPADWPVDALLREIGEASPARLVFGTPRTEVTYRDRVDVEGEDSRDPADRMGAWFAARAGHVRDAERARAFDVLAELMSGGIEHVTQATDKMAAGDAASEVPE